jgi:two-component system CheB/CheR fusion protein
MAARKKAKATVPAITQEPMDTVLPESLVNFPIVGIGASAGGLAAFEAFFSGMPTDVDPDMAFELLEPSAPRGQRLPIDFFFRSLAQDLHERAIGIVLSGTGSDGTLGLRAIKGEVGMAMAQNPASTGYDGMPRSAINTGLVDYELPPAEMPARLIAYATRTLGRTPTAAVQGTRAENALKKTFIILHAQTGHDFSHRFNE